MISKGEKEMNIDKIPYLGLGTYLPEYNESSKKQLVEVLTEDLKMGIRHIDTAQVYIFKEKIKVLYFCLLTKYTHK
jgi:diketogulonate reductase-like aldo/keto reductase